ncbi:uncharacterized protein LOC105778985 [Gossypium raimondii]|uniref:uncharacterized protein LOC105778985 n=1 Tax=Gossypium raimondii TaxID=29730 RepID=UPI00063AD4D7|nr:uncharacterized protein LOC105778985 [Gossypium raimondii]
MPNYVKFMKDILSKKRRLGEFEAVALTEGCTTILMNKLPPKRKGPMSFTISCSIGNHYVGKALCDLGASIDLMLMSIYRNLGIGKTRLTMVTLQLADRSYAHLKGKIEDVLVRVDKFIFPVDFLVLEFEADQNVPIIHGRPFLATETKVEEEFNRICHNNSDNNKELLERIDEVRFKELGEFMEAKQTLERPGKKFDSLDLSSHSFRPPRPSVEEPPTLELKPLPQHLKYEYLGDNSTLPILISAKLTFEQEVNLLEVL